MQRTVSVFILYIFLRLFDTSSAYLVDDNPYHHFVTFDQNTTYQLKWLVDWNQKRVVFNVTVKTTGFGLIRRAGETTGADIIIGGVFPNGRSYFSVGLTCSNIRTLIAWGRYRKQFYQLSRTATLVETNCQKSILVKIGNCIQLGRVMDRLS